MLRFPAPLIAKLIQSRISRAFRSAPARSPIRCVEPAEILHFGSAAPVSREGMQSITESTAPVIWIGGREPLDHPGIAHFVRVIAQCGHSVFLETSGALLCRRLHEFQPLPGLFLTLRLDTLHVPESGPAIEGLRAARLSGFFTVVHSRIRENLDFDELKPLRAFITENDVDGWLITAGSAASAAARKPAQARTLIPGVFWRQFSKLVEHELLLPAKDRESRFAARKVPAEASEESERVA